MAANGAADGTVVAARRQTAGRGRQGAVWQSPPGNLYFSMALKGGFAPSFALVPAVALAETLEVVVENVACKWPNDILVNGRKVAGILLQSSGEHMIMGIGVNVASHPAFAAFPAGSLQDEGAKATPEELLESFVVRFAAWRRRDFALVREAWLKRAYRLGKPIKARLVHETLTGVFQTLTDDGALILLQGGQQRRIDVAEVFFG